VAKISSLYLQSNEESVESDRQQRAPALESRETVAAKSSTIGKTQKKFLTPILRNLTNKAFFNSCRHLQSAIKPRCSTASGFPAAAVSNLDLAQRQLTIPRIRIAKKLKPID